MSLHNFLLLIVHKSELNLQDYIPEHLLLIKRMIIYQQYLIFKIVQMIKFLNFVTIVYKNTFITVN